MASLNFNNYQDDAEDLHAGNIKTVNILIVGLTGSGKSSIIKSICAPNQAGRAITKMSVRSVTKNLVQYRDNLITNPKDPKDK